MAFLPSGLKKQFSKANQLMSERISGVEGTKLDSDFTDMERRTDLFIDLVEELQAKTKEFLQPNPVVRSKMAAVKGISKLSGQAKASTYPQPEGTLGEAMSTYGKKLHDFDRSSVLAAALMEMGDSMKQMADVRYALDDTVKQNFLEPLQHTQNKDLKEVLHHRKKLQGRKLDFDCKKRTGAKEEEIKQAEDKFAESLQLAQIGMHNALDGSVAEHTSQLSQLAKALLDHHRNCASILEQLTKTLEAKVREAGSRPRPDFRPKTLEDLGIGRDHNLNNNASLSVGSYNTPLSSPKPAASGLSSSSSSSSLFDAWDDATPAPSMRIPTEQPTCQALYDFEAQAASELSFSEGQTIVLVERVDDNWFRGKANGKTGIFPVDYVRVIVPLN